MSGRAEKHKYFPNPLKNMKRAIRESVAKALEETADSLVEESKALLQLYHGDGPAWTGELYDSLFRGNVTVKPSYLEIKLYANATNPDNGAMYAQFLEEGTGDQGTHTGPKWRYKGRDGNWYTTSGIKAEPFLLPPVAAGKKELMEKTRGYIVDSFHTGWYEGSQQLWGKSTPSNQGGIRTSTHLGKYYVRIGPSQYRIHFSPPERH